MELFKSTFFISMGISLGIASAVILLAIVLGILGKLGQILGRAVRPPGGGPQWPAGGIPGYGPVPKDMPGAK